MSSQYTVVQAGYNTMSKRGWLLLGAAVPLLTLFALLGWASARSGGTPGSLGVNTRLGEVAVPQRPARPFSLELLDGRTLSLSDFTGQVVMLDFWASWCPPCRQEAPVLAAAYPDYAAKSVAFVGISIWDRPEDARAYVSRYGLTYPNGIDVRGAIAIDYGVRGIPEKFFISRDGVVTRKFVGPMDERTLRSTLDELLAAGR